MKDMYALRTPELHTAHSQPGPWKHRQSSGPVMTVCEMACGFAPE